MKYVTIIYMSRVRRIRDKIGYSVYYNMDTMRRNATMIQNEDGIFDIAKQVASNVASKLTGNLPKRPLQRQQQKSLKRGAEHVARIISSSAS